MIVLYMVFCYLLINIDAHKGYIESNYGYNGLHKYIASIFDIPYHVVIAYRNYYCSGSIIRSRVIVTSASCLEKRSKERVVVKVGASAITGFGQVIEVIDVKPHEYFRHSSILDNDIALLYLKEHVLFGPTVKKIILVEPAKELPEGTTLDVSGWGNVEHSPKYANSLLWSEMTILSHTECQERYPFLKTESNFCVKYFPERRLADNGGPATNRGLLVGILSYGACGGEEPFVALLTNVSYFHRWITLNSKRFLMSECSQYITDHDLDSVFYTS